MYLCILYMYTCSKKWYDVPMKVKEGDSVEDKKKYYTRSRAKCNAEYLQTLDEIKIRVPKGKKDEYKAAAKIAGKSMNQFIIDCIEQSPEKGRCDNMKKYKDMTMEEIMKTVKKGGDDKEKLNQMVADHLDTLDLPDSALSVIRETPIDVMAEVFGGLMTSEEVVNFICGGCL